MNNKVPYKLVNIIFDILTLREQNLLSKSDIIKIILKILDNNILYFDAAFNIKIDGFLSKPSTINISELNSPIMYNLDDNFMHEYAGIIASSPYAHLYLEESMKSKYGIIEDDIKKLKIDNYTKDRSIDFFKKNRFKKGVKIINKSTLDIICFYIDNIKYEYSNKELFFINFVVPLLFQLSNVKREFIWVSIFSVDLRLLWTNDNKSDCLIIFQKELKMKIISNTYNFSSCGYNFLAVRLTTLSSDVYQPSLFVTAYQANDADGVFI